MKKFIIILSALAVLLCSCSKEEPITEPNESYEEVVARALTKDSDAISYPIASASPSTDKYVVEYTEWVDLGLPSGKLWADRNVGANTKLEFGWYLSWAETSPKSAYTWNTYKFWDGTYTTDDRWQGYKIPCTPKHGYGVTFSAEDDVCTQLYGKGAYTPTAADFTELLSNTDVEFKTIGPVMIAGETVIEAVDVLICYSRANPVKYLVLPLSGIYDEVGFYPGFFCHLFSSCGKVGYYWMNSTHLDYYGLPESKSYYCLLNEWLYDMFGVDELMSYSALEKYHGLTVRAVKN